jgi:hypothetical protein
MKWVKASERLPKEAGFENKVIVKYKNFIVYGWKNYADSPEMYFQIGDKEYITNDVEWLDEGGNRDRYTIYDDIRDLILSFNIFKKIKKDINEYPTKYRVGQYVLIIDESCIKAMKVMRVIVKGWNRKSRHVVYMFKYPNDRYVYRNEDRCYKNLDELYSYYNANLPKININENPESL